MATRANSKGRVVTLVQERETKNKIRFQENADPDGKPLVFETAYVAKAALAAMDPPNPAVLKVTLEAG